MNYVLAMTLRNSNRKMPLYQINSRIMADKMEEMFIVTEYFLDITEL